MSVRAGGAAAHAPGGLLADALPAPTELGGLGAVARGDAASLRLEPLASPPAARVTPHLACVRPIDPRARTLLASLGARVRDVAEHAPAELGPHREVLARSARAVASMVATLRELEALEREASVGVRRGALRA